MANFSLFLLFFCVATVATENILSPLDILNGDVSSWLFKTMTKVVDFLLNFIGAPKFVHNNGDVSNNRVTMLCYDKKQKEYKSIGSSRNIDKNLPVVIIIHGWRRLTNLTWMKDMATDYRKHIKTNVCLIYWEELAWHYDIREVKKEAMKLVVRRTVEFIEKLNKNHSIHYDDISIVGHGIGAHIAGVASSKSKSQIGAIYALDPFGPLFTTLGGEKLPKGRLDMKHAKYVQAIHTSSNALGSSFKVGHQNFRPNLGRSPQIPCLDHILPFLCSHEKAIEYFRYSLNLENDYTAMKCRRNITKYIVQKCGKRDYDRLGVHARRVPGYFYFEPLSVAPYAPKNITKK